LYAALVLTAGHSVSVEVPLHAGFGTIMVPCRSTRITARKWFSPLHIRTYKIGVPMKLGD